MKTSGEILKAKREKLNLNISAISKKLKIHEKYLRALEENDYSIFDSRVIARGFLIKYADFLNVNTEKVVAYWRRDFVVDVDSVDTRNNIWNKFSITPKLVVSILFVLIITLLTIVAYVQYQNVKEPPYINIVSPTDGTTVDSDLVILEGYSDSSSEVELNNSSISIDEEGKFVENLYLSPGVNKFTINVTNKLGVENSKTITIYNSKVDEEANISQVEPDNNQNLDILLVNSISTEEPVFIEVKNQEETLFTGFLLPNSNKEFIGEDLSFYTDKIEFIDISYNEEEFDTGEKEYGMFSTTFEEGELDN